MECDTCGTAAVMHAAYSGRHLCQTHFTHWVEQRVRRRVRQDGLVTDDASPTDPVTWLIGLSGGKDSVVLTQILSDTFADDPRIDLRALSIHEGIEGYRDESLAAAETLTGRLELPHETISYEAELGVRMDEVVEDDPEDMAACAYCGVFRRDLLSRNAEKLDADLLLTGHNLDDEAETAFMNFLEGDIEQMATHFDASLGPMDERSLTDRHVPRAKPLRDVPEKEVALYARLQDLPAHISECPHAHTSFRGEIQSLLYDLEESHPGTRHSIMAGYERLARLAARSVDREQTYESCETCGSPTTGGRCRRCQLLDAVGA